MQRSELAELHYITPIANLPSIFRLGILSHNRAKHVPHDSVAMNEIQVRRAKVTIPGGRKLHDKEVALTVRHLNILSWIGAKVSNDLPIREEDILRV